MLKTVIIDTNIFLRFILNDIPKDAEKAEVLFEKAKKKTLKIIVPQIVIFEIHFTLDKYYQFEKEKVVGVLANLVSSEYLDVQDGVTFLSAIVIFRDKNISFVDSFLIALSKKYSAELITYDKKLKKSDKV